MILIAFVVGVQALLHSYKKHHQNIQPILFFLIGIILLITKQFFISAETYFVIPAVACIIYAHIYNFTLSKKAKCSSPYHVH